MFDLSYFDLICSTMKFELILYYIGKNVKLNSYSDDIIEVNCFLQSSLKRNFIFLTLF